MIKLLNLNLIFILPNSSFPIGNCLRGLVYKFSRFVNQWKVFISPVSTSFRLTFLGFCLIVFYLSYLRSLLFSFSSAFFGNKSCSFAKTINFFYPSMSKNVSYYL